MGVNFRLFKISNQVSLLTFYKFFNFGHPLRACKNTKKYTFLLFICSKAKFVPFPPKALSCHTSRIISRLEDEELIFRKNDGSIIVSDPDLLLDSWCEKYDFKKNQIIKGYIADRSSIIILKKISDLLSDEDILHAATGLSGAWLYRKFANFRIVSFYIEAKLSRNLFKVLGFRQEERGSNVWFVVPKDEGVFHGSSKVEGITCAHPIQVYLDLFGHPERAMDAANDLRKHYLKWNKHA